jgi:hypothetical protein
LLSPKNYILKKNNTLHHTLSISTNHLQTALDEYLKNQRENQRLMKSVEIGTTLLFISFFILVAIRPTMAAISTLLGEIKSKEILQKSMKTKISQVMAAQDEFSKVQEKYLIVNSALPDSPEYGQASAQVLGAAQASQVTIDKLIFDIEKEDDQKAVQKIVDTNLQEYVTNFGVYSDFQSGLKFLTTLYQNAFFKLMISTDHGKKQNTIETDEIDYFASTISAYALQQPDQKTCTKYYLFIAVAL